MKCAQSLVQAYQNPRARKLSNTYGEEVRASIGKYASVHGPTAAPCEFSKRHSHTVPESTTRKFRDLYVKELERQRSSGSISIFLLEKSI